MKQPSSQHVFPKIKLIDLYTYDYYEFYNEYSCLIICVKGSNRGIDFFVTNPSGFTKSMFTCKQMTDDNRYQKLCVEVDFKLNIVYISEYSHERWNIIDMKFNSYSFYSTK